MKLFFLAIKPLLFSFLLVAFIKTVNAQKKDYHSTLTNCLNQHQIQLNKTNCMNGVTAPDFTSSTIDGNIVQLAKLKGKVVVLNFWFIACVPCRMEVPALNEIAEKFKNEKIVFISIAFDNQDNLKKHLATNKFLFQTIADPKYLICKNIYNITAYPTTVIIDKKGKIILYFQGGKDTKEAAYNDVRERLVPVINTSLGKKQETIKRIEPVDRSWMLFNPK